MQQECDDLPLSIHRLICFEVTKFANEKLLTAGGGLLSAIDLMLEAKELFEELGSIKGMGVCDKWVF